MCFCAFTKSDEGFYQAQEKIKSVLEYDHYPSFIVTDLYEKALEQIENDEKSSTTAANKKVIKSVPSVNNLTTSTATLTRNLSQNLQKSGNSTDPNKIQVENLIEKLSMKLSALNAFKSNGYQQVDSKVI